MIASDHDKKRSSLNQTHQKRPAFLMGLILFLRDYTLPMKCRLYSAQGGMNFIKVAGVNTSHY